MTQKLIKKLKQLIDKGKELTFEKSVTIRRFRGQESPEYNKPYQNWMDEVRECITTNFKNETGISDSLEEIEELEYIDYDDIYYSEQEARSNFRKIQTQTLEMLNEALEIIEELPTDDYKSEQEQSEDEEQFKLNDEEQNKNHLSKTNKTTPLPHKQLLVFYDKKNDELISMIMEMLELLNMEGVLLGQEEIVNSSRKSEKIKGTDKGYDGAIVCIQEPIEKKTERSIILICYEHAGKILLLWNTELESAEFEKIQKNCFDEIEEQETKQRVNFNQDSINFNFIKALKNFLKTIDLEHTE